MNRPLSSRSILAGLLLVAALITVAWLARPRPAVVALPLPDLQGVHPQLALALQTQEETLRLDLSSAAQWGELGMLLMAHGWSVEAASAFDGAAQRDPADVRWMYLRAMLLEAVDLEAAAEVYAQAALLDPSYAPLRYRWAHVLIQLDQLPAAEEQLRAAAQLAPDSPHPLLALGRAAIDRQDLPAARTAFQQATAVAPFCREAREQLARVHFLLDNQAQAERDQKLAGSLPPAFPGLADPILQEVNQHELVARQSAERADQLVASGDAAAAAAAFQKLIQDRPDLSRPRLNLAALLAMQGDMRNAAAMYREIIELFPSEALAQQGLGDVLAGSGDIDGAINAYQRSVDLKPDFAPAHHALGQLYEQRGQLADAVAAYREAINADARYAPAHLALGLALQRQGELDTAIAAIENAVRLAPHDAVPRGYLQRARQSRQSTKNRQDPDSPQPAPDKQDPDQHD